MIPKTLDECFEELNKLEGLEVFKKTAEAEMVAGGQFVIPGSSGSCGPTHSGTVKVA